MRPSSSIAPASGIGLAAAMLAFALTPAIGRPLTETPPPASAEDAPAYTRVMVKEAESREACEAVPERVFVRHRYGTECIAYMVSKGHELQRRAVIYLEGDIPKERMAPEIQAGIVKAHRRTIQAMADRFGVPFIAVSRPGVLGSSGNHGWRRRPAEALSIDAAIDAIKRRHGIDFITVAGQSGGSTIAASLLTLGRRDITCAVLGSGNLSVVDLYLERQEGTKRVSREVVERSFYDPALHIRGIVSDPARRVIVIGDPEDRRTPFPQQRRFAALMETAGHHANVIAVTGSGPDNHGVSYATLPAAGLCTLAISDKAIANVVLATKPPVRTGKPAAAALPDAAANGASTR